MSRNCKGYSPSGGCFTGDISTDYAVNMVTGQPSNDYGSNVSSHGIDVGNQLGTSLTDCNVKRTKTGGFFAEVSDPTGNKHGAGVNQRSDCKAFRDSLVVSVQFDVNNFTNNLLHYKSYFNRNFYDILNKTIAYIKTTNFKINAISMYRDSRTDSGRLSWHDYGVAIDFSPDHNPYTTGCKTYCCACGHSVGDDDIHIRTTDHYLVKELCSYGWHWGGIWKKHDYMHFCLTNG